MSEEIECCPFDDCESSQIYSNTNHPASRYDDVPNYRCDDCGRGFDEPDRRPKRRNTDGRTGLAKRLAEIGEGRS